MASSSAAARSSPDLDRPNMSELRIVLIGKRSAENYRVENLIRNKLAAVFYSGASTLIQQTRFSWQEKNFLFFNYSHLFHTSLTQSVSVCMNWCASGPQVFLLILQYKDFTEQDRHRVEYILSHFSQKAIDHTIVLTTDEETPTSVNTSYPTRNAIHSLIKTCGGRHLQFDERKPGCDSELFTEIEKILKEGQKDFVIYSRCGDGSERKPMEEDFENSDQRLEGKIKKSTKRESDRGETISGKAKLNFVLCGNNSALKSQVSKVIRGSHNQPKNKPLSKECVKKEVKIDGRLISVVELPALTTLSEEEVMRETHHCLYLCDPGVDLFMLVTPVTKLTDEDRAEMEKIRRIFNSNEHFMVLFTSEHTVDQKVSEFVLSAESQKIVSLYGSWYRVMELKDSKNSAVISELVNYTDNRKTESYTLYTVIKDKQELEEKLKETDSEIQHLKQKINTLVSVKLNLVLCGNKALKSSISALIMNECRRGSVVSSEFKRTDVDLDGRLISLMEFPALINLSEEEVMRQTLRCVSLCQPGVHLFILIIPDGPLNNEDRAEIKKIQKIFSSRINKHMMILIQQDSELYTAELSEETQTVIQSLGGRHYCIDPNTPVSTLMEKIEQMLEENRREVFSTETFLELQMEKLQEYDEMKMKVHSLETWFQSQDLGDRADEVRIVLLGKTGVGKSATGNTILGREAFTSDISLRSITKECQKQTAEINGRSITVIDTPGLFDTQLSNEETKREISNCISMILPGPHVFLLLISLGRFTQEEQESVKIIQENFGENSLKYTIVLFTRGDDLKNKTIEECLEEADSALKNLIETCGNRVHVFNNNQTEDRTQVSDLLKKIEKMVKENGDSYYSCRMFREKEREIQEKQKMILEVKMEQLKKEREELIKKHEKDKERMKTMMQKERQHHNEEIKRIKGEFGEREERHYRDIKEMEEKERKMREEMRRERQQRDEEDKRRREKEQEMRDEHKEEKERMKMMMEEERENYDKQRKRRRKIEKETWDEYFEQFKRDRQIILLEKEELKLRHEAEKEKMKRKKEKERQYHDEERKRREDEFRVEQYKRDIKDIEDCEKVIQEEMKKEREEWERQKELEREEKQKINQLYKKILEVQHTNNEGASASDPECLRILLFGRTGSGKSATGNIILGKQQFRSEESKDPVTRVCQKRVGKVNGQSVSVVDTPGLFDWKMSKEQVEEQILKCISMSAPGPHVFIIVVSLKKIIQEVRDTLGMITQMFGPEAAKHIVVLFTKDKLKNQTIAQYVKASRNVELMTLISDCGNRILAFNNTKNENITELFNTIEELKKSNQGRYFTNEMFQEAEVSRRKEIIREKERKNLTELKKLEARYEMEISNRRKRLEDRKRKTEEQVRIEKKIREKAERLWREFEEKENSEMKKQEMENQKQADLEKQMTEEYNQRIEELKREIEDQRKQNEKQQEEREEEDRKREEKYNQDQEKIKTMEDTIAELLNMKQEEIKRDSEEQVRKEQEEKEKEEWMRKIKEAESDERDNIEQQHREWEEENKQQMREREEEKRKTIQRFEDQLRETEEELEKLRQKSERDREDRQMRKEERQKQRDEREETVQKYVKEINELKRQYEQLQKERKEECESRKREDRERREEKRRRWRKIIENLNRDQEEIRRRGREEREIIEREKKECDEIQQNQDDEIEKMRKKHQDEARKQEEELKAFTQRVDQQVQKLKDMITLIYAEETAKREKWSCHVM